VNTCQLLSAEVHVTRSSKQQNPHKGCW